MKWLKKVDLIILVTFLTTFNLKIKQKEKVELIYDETCNTIDVVVDDEYISVFDLEVGSNALKYEIIEEISDLLNYFGIEHKLKKVE